MGRILYLLGDLLPRLYILFRIAVPGILLATRFPFIVCAWLGSTEPVTL